MCRGENDTERWGRLRYDERESGPHMRSARTYVFVHYCYIGWEMEARQTELRDSLVQE
ncbi:hypothetical protein KDI_51810 [Dictyobacter arantiisoli]|uniref:Uncharacterized protein n=1 Tax=Dictyobacter arantiisoli TaxID=2014874 RepID=A0A5A5TJL1_9CHLR|nr:hypothetical protein KDI_51810 [Dictyobacter arantiisoli]